MFISKVRARFSYEHQTKLEGICSSAQWLVFVLFLTYSLARSRKTRIIFVRAPERCRMGAGNTGSTRYPAFSSAHDTFYLLSKVTLCDVFSGTIHNRWCINIFYWITSDTSVSYSSKTVPSCYVIIPRRIIDAIILCLPYLSKLIILQ